ncbi:MAG TPA: ABC transporter permease [Candidatus Limnocylindrales bacterium]|nr:ABC transporter permease [Candidatus Limnocylindrales bacterium]
MNWLSRLLRKPPEERQVDSELQFHVEQQVADYVASGMDPHEARRRARAEFGDVEHVKEDCYEARQAYFFETLWQDVRYGLRILRKDLGFTAIAVLTLGLGIGANTAIFSLVNGVLLRTLPFPNAQRLVSITGTYPKGAFAAMREQVHTMDVAGYYEGHELNLTGVGDPLRLNATLVSAELFSVLGATPKLGRTFFPGEDITGKNHFVILSYRLWQERFGGDPSVVGHWVDIEGVHREIVGVMSADFRFPSLETDIWVPLDLDPRNATHYWADDFMPVVARLHAGVTLEQATAEIRIFQSRVRGMFPWRMPDNWNPAVAAVPLEDSIVGDFRSRLLILLGAVALVLLIACANVANLTLARAATREKEIALRSSLGASRPRIIRQLITESTVMAGVGGALGLFLASGGLSFIKAALPADTPRLAEVGIDWRVLIFTAGLAVLTGLASGVVPALQSSKTDVTESLKAGGRGASLSVNRHWRKALVIGELGLAVLLVSAAGLLIRSLWALSHVNPGFRAEHLVTARVTPNQSFCDDRGRCEQFYRSLIDQLKALPGVSAAAIVNTLPLNGRVSKRAVDFENYVPPPGNPGPLVWQDVVSADYLRLMGIPILRGRSFTEADSAGNPPVAIVSESTARKFWPSGDAVGQHMMPTVVNDQYTIVGVVPDVLAYDLHHDEPSWIDGTVYVPYGPKASEPDGRMPAEMSLVVRTTLDQRQIERLIREIVTNLNPETPVSELRAMPEVLSASTSAPRAVTYLFVSFAGLALILGIVGIYGVISFFVGQRTREIGIRMALGAQRLDVLKMVVNEGLSLTLTGVAIGLAAAFGLTRLLRTWLYGVSATDPVSLLAVALLFILVALVACYVPARRATRVDPVIALHQE